jgi:hypothetical protein
MGRGGFTKEDEGRKKKERWGNRTVGVPLSFHLLSL